MIKNKLSKIIGPAAGVMVFMMSAGTIPVQAYAAEVESVQNEVNLSKETENVQNEASLTGNGNMNYEIEENGVKIKITDIIGTKNKIKMNAVITKEDGLDEDIYNHRNIALKMYMEKEKANGGGSSWSYPDEKTLEIKAHEESEKGFPEKGNIRADLVIGECDVNRSIVIPVDFTESFKQYMKKDLDISIDKDNKIIGFESDAIGTRIIISKALGDLGYRRFDDELNSYFIIKAGNKMYNADDIERVPGNDGDDNLYIRAYESEGITYNDIKDEDNISIIPINSNLTSEEIANKYKDISSYEKLLKESVVSSDNIKYNKEIKFKDETKGEIKAERKDNKIKIYCSSDSDIKSFFLAQSINGIFTDGTENDRNSIYDKDKVIYKDENTENQYVAEFKDSYPEKLFETYINTILLNYDNYSIGDEIKIK